VGTCIQFYYTSFFLSVLDDQHASLLLAYIRNKRICHHIYHISVAVLSSSLFLFTKLVSLCTVFKNGDKLSRCILFSTANLWSYRSSSKRNENTDPNEFKDDTRRRSRLNPQALLLQPRQKHTY
jgi:hypothetical protein